MLTTGLVAAGVESLHRGQKRIETPHLDACGISRRVNRCSGGVDADGLITADVRTSKSGAPIPLSPANAWRSSRPSGATFPTPSTWVTAFWSAIPGRAGGIGRRWTSSPLYVDQKPNDDQSAERAREFGFKVYPTIPEALRCGGKKLAVDAVLIIGEHGDYPQNDKGQILYPRYEFFRETTRVFEQDGRAVPIFNDKHLSFSFAKANEMVQIARRLKFPFLAGSSLPVTWRLPPIELPLGCVIDEALMVGVGSSDADGFPRTRGHAMHGRAPSRRRDRSQERAASRRATRSGKPAERDAGRPSCWQSACPGPTRFRD